MEKINSFNKKEISCELAWRIIYDMQAHTLLSNNHIIAVRISCYKDKKILNQLIQNLFGICVDIQKFKKPFPLNLLPIPSPHYFYLVMKDFQHVFDLAKLCDDFLMFEIAIIDEISFDAVKTTILNSGHTLYENMVDLSHKCQTFFMCGFDFDDPDYESGVSQVAYFNFIPNNLSLYFI